MMRSISHNATAVLACSETTLDAFTKRCRPRTQFRQVLYNGVDTKTFAGQVNRLEVRSQLGLPADRPLVTYVARFMPHKNYQQMLRIAERFAATGNRAHFVLAGSHGSELAEIQAISKQMPNVTVLVGLPDVSGLLKASDIFFFPSLEEGFGVVALEAACAGLPIVATDLPSIREALAPSHRDLTFAPNDDEGAFQLLSKLSSEPELRQTLANDGRKWAESFSMDRSVKSIARVYDLLAGQQPESKVA